MTVGKNFRIEIIKKNPHNRRKNIDDCGDRTHEPEGSGPKPDAFDHFAKSSHYFLVESILHMINTQPPTWPSLLM